MIGNTVNLASRMEALSRTLDTRAVFSDAAVQAAGVPDGVRPAGAHEVRGARGPVDVWVLG